MLARSCCPWFFGSRCKRLVSPNDLRQLSQHYQSEHRKRRINPEGVRVDIDGLRTVTDAIEILINDALELPPAPDK